MKNDLKNPYAEIVFPVPVEHAFTYLVPPELDEDVIPGVRVLAPFGPRKTTGFVVARKDTTDYPDLKNIDEVLDPVPLFTPEVLALAKWIADYYICGWGEVLKAALPSGINMEAERMVRLLVDDPDEIINELSTRAPRQAEIIRRVAAHNPLPMSQLKKQIQSSSLYSSLKSLKQSRYVRMELALPKARVNKKHDIYVRIPEKFTHDELEPILADLSLRAPKQAQCLDFVMKTHNRDLTRAFIARENETNAASVQALVDKGYLELETVEVIRDYYDTMEIEKQPQITLNHDQNSCLTQISEQLDKNEFLTFLLHGVTGSGKTQVYIEAIYKTLSLNKTAIVLVPEIALTPQMVSRFRSHFGNDVAVFHSRMSPGERYDSWRLTWEGKKKIVIGPRSAIYAPLRNVGLIVVDEEHEPSYKQNDLTPRYHARDVSVIRAFMEKAVVVLGSATPAVESFYNSKIKKYTKISLPNRIDAIPMPTIDIVDMKREPKIIGRKDPIIFSRKLREKMDEKLALGEQVILFLNRRGFATIFKCQTKDCGYTAKCKNCDITLTYHIHGNKLKCHYCGFTQRTPQTCPDCRGSDVFFRGIGTQRIEDELLELFPGVNALRMDLDTTRGKMAHDKILKQFGTGDYQILLGTQMVAKGLDFPNVTLVGVINADTELLFPDFRAAERTFQLLTQVAGRAGRKDKHGEVVIQTFSPEHYSLQYAKTHNYHHFFQAEIQDRKMLAYPPYSRLVNILFKGEDEMLVQDTAHKLLQYIPKDGSFKILGPSPAPLAKIQNNYRWQILFSNLKSQDNGGKVLKNAIRKGMQLLKEKHKFRGVSISIDVDPTSIL